MKSLNSCREEKCMSSGRRYSSLRFFASFDERFDLLGAGMEMVDFGAAAKRVLLEGPGTAVKSI